MNTPTYKEQFDKITRAYFSCELWPYNPCACFVGNLLNNTSEWIGGRYGSFENGNHFSYNYNYREGVDSIRKESNNLYSPDEIASLEELFLSSIAKDGDNGISAENALYNGMDCTLDALRKIHESKGEVVDTIPFKKRQLANV